MINHGDAGGPFKPVRRPGRSCQALIVEHRTAELSKMNDVAQAVLSMLIVGLANVLAYALNEHSLFWRLCKGPSLYFVTNR